MSAPQTNLQRQKRRHWGPIVGITVALAFVVFLGVSNFWQSTTDEDAGRASQPETSVPATEPMADPSAAPATGAEEQVTPGAPTAPAETPAPAN
ncbi:hypothetical protein [Szabonella alba]|uniref:Uncharacterized protein n=1 Tax=Szabonella alba TaxID=2804194 RepID=A0A8K0V7P4_9RHOB|nr:hypothetical protein [Szabonella alba]MBL4917259.1 hypothetical protein [Szabonella alba]